MEPERKHLFILVVILIPTLLILMRGWDDFAYPSANASFSDLTLTHYTNTIFLRDQLWNEGSLPLWAPTILSGYPFIASPLNGIWYSFGWLALLLPLPFAYNLLAGFHLSWGVLGMFLLLRSQRIDTLPSLFGSLGFGLLPKLYAHYGAGHLTLIYAVPWTPWLLLTTRKTLKKKSWKKILMTGLILGLIFLADVRWAAYAGLLWLEWSVYLYWFEVTNHEDEIGNPLISWGLLVGGTLIIAALLSAVLWLPMLEYVRLSARELMQAEDILEFSLEPLGILGILYPPMTGGSHETSLYVGGLNLLLSLAALFLWRRDRTIRFWGLTAIVAFGFALGENLPFTSLLAHLPLTKLLRVPSRTLFILGMAQVTMAASALSNWGVLIQKKPSYWLRLIFFSIVSFTILISGLTLVFIRPENGLPLLWGGFTILVSSVILLLAIRHNKLTPIFYMFLFLFLLIDAGLSGQAALGYRSYEEVVSEKKNLVKFLSGQEGKFRTYSPSFSLPQHLAQAGGIEEADGIDPIYLKSYASYMAAATNVPWEGYSVTVPPTDSMLLSNEIYSPDAQLLGNLNVQFVLAAYELPPTPGLEYTGVIDDVYIYENVSIKPRAWLVKEHDSTNNPQAAQILDWTPNQIRLMASGPGRLILSEIVYPGWRAMIDGEALLIEPYENLLRSVYLPPGTHQVIFSFKPSTYYWGCTLSTVAWLSLLIVIFYQNSSRIINDLPMLCVNALLQT